MNLSSILSSSNASLRFPLDKVETADDYVMFTVYKYHPPYRKAKCLDETGGSIWGGRFADYDTTGLGGGDLDTSEFKKMILYMPEDVSVNATQKWNGKSVGAAETAALRAAANAVDKIPGVKTKEQAGELAKNLATPGPGMAKGFAKAGALKAAASVMSGIDANDIGSGVLGQTLNPNLEVFYDSPQLRTFRFDWLLVPRNQRESRIIKEIVWQFKRASAPEIAGAGWFLKVPNVFKIEYKTGSNENHWLNKMKACALTSLNVSYTAAGSYSTLEDGAPTAVNLSLSFQEMKAILADDYGDSFSYTKQYY